jgi:hypothetical protein
MLGSSSNSRLRVNDFTILLNLAILVKWGTKAIIIRIISHKTTKRLLKITFWYAGWMLSNYNTHYIFWEINYVVFPK